MAFLNNPLLEERLKGAFNGGLPSPMPTDQPATTPAPAARPLATAPLPRPLATAPVPSPAENAHQAEYSRLTGAGANPEERKSGIQQVHNPILRTLGTIADAVGTGLFPNIAAVVPGTQAHHNVLVGQEARALGQEQTNRKNTSLEQEEAARAAELQSRPELTEARNQLGLEKLGEEQRAHQATEDINRTRNEGEQKAKDAARRATLVGHGFQENPETGDITPIDYEHMSPEQQATYDLHSSQRELADATAQLRKAQVAKDPKSEELARMRLDIANRRLGLSQQTFNARYQGVGPDGQPLAGALLTDDNRVVPPVNAENVRPTATSRDAANRGDTMLSLDARIRKALQNPAIAKGVGPLEGRLKEAEGRLGVLPHDLAELKNDLVSYGAFQAGLHPVRGIGALQYFDKVMGGLGQDPQQLLGKLDSNKATAENVKRVGEPKTVGSNAVNRATAVSYSDGGKTYNIPADQEKEFLRDHPGAKKSNGR